MSRNLLTSADDITKFSLKVVSSHHETDLWLFDLKLMYNICV